MWRWEGNDHMIFANVGRTVMGAGPPLVVGGAHDADDFLGLEAELVALLGHKVVQGPRKEGVLREEQW